jgi:tetratricopeptide (TPR) repeat protein
VLCSEKSRRPPARASFARPAAALFACVFLLILHPVVAEPLPERTNTPPAAQLDSAIQEWNAGNTLKALDDLQNIIRNDPSYDKAYFYLALFYTHIGQSDIAERYAERAVTLQPTAGAYYNALGAALAAREKHLDALQQFRHALERVPRRQQAAVWENIGEMHMRLGQPNEAIDAYYQTLSLDPGDDGPLAVLAELLLQQNRVEESVELLLAASADGSASPSVYLTLGLAQMRTNDLDAASRSLRHAASLAPENKQVSYALAQVLRRLGRKDDAAAELARYQELQKQTEANEARVRHLRNSVATASELLSEGRLAHAEETLQQLLAIEPDYPTALHLLGFVQLKSNQLTAATSTLERAVGLDPVNAETNFYLGYAMLLSGDLEAAQAATERAILIYAWDARYHAQLGFIQSELLLYQPAREAFNRALEQDPDSFAARLGLGSVNLLTNRLDEAEANLRAAVALAEENADARRLLGLTLWQQYRFPEAVEQYEINVQLKPDSESSNRILVDALVTLKEKTIAEMVIRRWQQASPGSRMARYYLADLMYSSGRYQDALREFSATLELRGDDPPDAIVKIRLGQVYSGLNQIDDAIEAYRQAKSFEPLSTASYGALGNLYLMRNLNKEALEQFMAIVELEPGNAQAHANLAQTHLRLSQYPQAVASAQAALQIDGEMNEAWYSLAQALRRLGRDDEAREAIEKFQQREAELQSLEHRARERGALVQEAMSEIERGEFEPAVNLLQEAVRFDPQRGYPYMRLGLAQSLAGRHEEAVRSLEQALVLEPDVADLYRLLSEEYRYLGDADESKRLRAEYQRALENQVSEKQ